MIVAILTFIAIALLFAVVAIVGVLLNRYQAGKHKRAILALLVEHPKLLGGTLYALLPNRPSLQTFRVLVQQLEAEGRIKSNAENFIGANDTMARWWSRQ